jgi:hypothetical protein
LWVRPYDEFHDGRFEYIGGPQTGGGDDLEREAKIFDANLERHLDAFEEATGAGDAGERDYLERAHAVLRDGHRRHLREPPGGKNLTLCEVDAIAAALRSSHREGAETISDDMNAAHWHGYREGAEAMRGLCAMAHEQGGGGRARSRANARRETPH